MSIKNKLICLKNKETLKFDDFYFKCSVGKKGLTSIKREGDNKTPRGKFDLGNIFYRADRIKKPFTKLTCKKITPKMGWCDDQRDRKNYNKLIISTEGIKCEKLFRNDNKYDYFIPILYNSKKRILGKGSAIFIHLTKDYKKTAGCIALNKKDFKILVRLINKKTKLLI